MVDNVDHARDLLWDSLLSALRATRLHADPFHIPYPGAGGGPAPSVSTGFRSAIESPSAGRTWWLFWWPFVSAFGVISGDAHRKQVPEILAAAHDLLASANGFPSWTSPVRPRRPLSRVRGVSACRYEARARGGSLMARCRREAGRLGEPGCHRAASARATWAASLIQWPLPTSRRAPARSCFRLLTHGR